LFTSRLSLEFRILNIMKRWVEQFFTDFDPQLKQMFMDFISSSKDSQIQILKKVMEVSEKKDSGSFSESRISIDKVPAPALPLGGSYTFENIDPQEVIENSIYL
jgi:hypothetical protein